jgi:hypothetical protein
MSFFGFQEKLYLFGGKGDTGVVNDLFVLDLKNNWKELDLGTYLIDPTYYATTTMVATSGTNFSCNVYVIGGKRSYDYHTKIMKFELKNFRSFWFLHLLKTTGVSNLIHYHMCLDLVLMYQGNNLYY